MDLRNTIFTAAGLALVSQVPVCGSSKTPVSRPNILFILVDDLGLGDLSCQYAKDLHTPNIDRLFETISFVHSQNSMRIPTGKLNEVLAESTARVQPPTDKGKRLRIYYMTQASTRPPAFVFFVNDAKLFHFSYQRYLENRIREVFGLSGTPVRFIIRERGEGKK